jgi:O-antigen/teichoic acid export membrane protein
LFNERLQGLTSRFGWGMADQLVWSLTNFALSVTIARSVSVEKFGEYTLVFWTYLLLLNLGRAFGSHPLWVIASHVGGDKWRKAQAGSAGFNLVAACLFGIGLIIAGMVIGGQALSFAALGLGLPGLLVQDSYRFGMIADGRARLSFGSDLTWAIVMAGLLGLLALIWAAGALGGSAYAIWACRVLPAPGSARSWLSDNARLIPGFSVAGLAEPVAMTSIQFILAATLGLAAVGAIRAGQLLMSPITVALQGIFAVLGPEASRLLRDEPGKFTKRMAGVALLLVGFALSYGVVALLLPGSLGEALLGDSWAYAREVLPYLIVAVAASSAASAAALGLLVAGAASTLAKLALATYPLIVLLMVWGGAWGGVTGAAAGLAVGDVVLVCANWYVFVRTNRTTASSAGSSEPLPGPTRSL